MNVGRREERTRCDTIRYIRRGTAAALTYFVCKCHTHNVALSCVSLFSGLSVSRPPNEPRTESPKKKEGGRKKFYVDTVHTRTPCGDV